MFPTSFEHAQRILDGRDAVTVANNTVLKRLDDNNVGLELHGNRIATVSRNNSLSLTLAGYPTATTRDRLHKVLVAFGYAKRYAICQRKFKQMVWFKDSDSYVEVSDSALIIFGGTESPMIVN